MPPSRVLEVCFDRAETFEEEYATNLVNGGIFVATDEAFQLRDRVQVDLNLGFCCERITLEGEIVHQIPRELEQAGATPGVAVQFDEPVSELRKRLGLLAGPGARLQPCAEDAGRRTAPRMDARVSVRIDATGATLQGHTRNLSRTGVLVSMSGHGVPVGQPVRLDLEHPTTGERMEIGGVVVRDVKTGGDVTALGIHFETSDGHRDEIERFIEHVQNAEHTRRLGGINGPIDELGVYGVIQMFGSTARAGTIVFKRSEDEAVVGFEAGMLRYVQLGAATGMKGLVRLVGWEEGRFEFHARLDPIERSDAPLPLDAALLEAARQLDEESRVDRSRFAPGARPRVGDAQPAETLSKVGEAVMDLVRAGFTVQRIVDVIPESDPEIYRAFADLADAGLIVFEDRRAKPRAG
jgi:Tfp pilus assembly protein PilZ